MRSSVRNNFIQTGVTEDMPTLHARAIILTNIIALISAILTSVYLVYILPHGWGFSSQVLSVTLLVLCSVPILNRARQVHLARVLLALAIPLASLTILFLNRVQHPDLYDYYRSPGIYSVLMATSIIPALIFTRSEKLVMFACMMVHAVVFATVDIFLRYFSNLHALPTAKQYIGDNLSLLTSYILLTSCVLSLKSVLDRFEARNELLIARLNLKNLELESTNRELHELNKNIETQNEEIQAQSEELIQSQESLILASNEIERQKTALQEQNRFLEKSLDEKSLDLLHTNQQLVQQNNELQQFSYTVSHNLRGPVASMMGLMNIHRLADTYEEKTNIMQLIEQSALSLETIIRDLNKIIDIRHDKFSALENVRFKDELDLIKQSLKSFLRENDVQVDARFACEHIVSIKAYVNSILYNLVSNAIQYRSPDRKPFIRISSHETAEYAVLEVADNGLGIDLTRFGGDLFKLYKRFHTHTEGKGLGLYLVRQQVEKLNGRIEVESVPDAGATFRVFFPVRK
ncbi:hypothetical protein KK062_10175 [Fulvivirgaceae bacterium PWU5]|uniref:histidine kinase n=1 Tax=Dawidia cretensis TaxID=2782350 RepID=A0AAP2DY77_9BACT|nr:ATP-binding protein [Dawidia cretensis]MBT1708594.1 hypothetical protein [Dawidia cretensis]